MKQIVYRDTEAGTEIILADVPSSVLSLQVNMNVIVKPAKIKLNVGSASRGRPGTRSRIETCPAEGALDKQGNPLPVVPVGTEFDSTSDLFDKLGGSNEDFKFRVRMSRKLVLAKRVIEFRGHSIRFLS